jgi:DNA-binding SARP family transcriptional activator
VEFKILGPLEVLDEGRAVSVRGARERAILAFLLLHAGEVVPADRLIDELWGEEPPESARKSLQVRVAGIRKALGAETVLTQGPGYTIKPGPDGLDLHRFERLVAEADRAEPAVAAGTLRKALSVWRGPALVDFAYEPFAQAGIRRLEELRLVALERWIDVELVLGRHADLVGELEALVVEHPLRERLRGQLMLALYRSGRQADALKVYRAARSALIEDLGIEPNLALQKLETAILRQDPALELSQPADQERSILVVPLAEASIGGLLALGVPLARRPPRELIVARIVAQSDDLGRASVLVNEARDALLGRGVAARAVAFRSAAPGEDVVRLAAEQDVDLLLVDAPAALLDDLVVQALLSKAPCDVALFVLRDEPPKQGSMLVPFGGAEHDWAAVELAAWIAGAQRVQLTLAGPIEEGRDASRLLASASLAVQRALGVAAEPLLLERGPDALLRAADDAGIVVLGLSDRWRKEGLGRVRQALAERARPPVVLVRRGLRPGGLAPREGLTRFTWSLGL